MTSPALAIAWEIWRKNRLGNLICLGTISAFAIQAIAWAAWRPPTRSEPALNGDAILWVFYPMLATFIWVFNTFAHSERDPRKGFSGVPARMFTLPVRTSFLVGCLMLYGVVAIIGLYLAWVGLVLRPFGIAPPVGWPLLVLAVGMSSFQTAVWGLASFPWIRIGTIAAGAAGLIAVSAMGFGEPSISWLNSERLTFLLLAWLPLTYAGAVFGVNAERRGGWQAWARVRPILRRIADALPRWRGPFTSAAQAQFWFEWRRKGWFLSALLALSIAGGIFLFPVAVVLDAKPPLPMLAILSALFYPLLVAGSGGLGLAKSEFWSSEVALQSFHGMRPLSDAELVLAKLKVITAVTVLGWVLSAPLVGGLWFWTRWHDMWMVQWTETLTPVSAVGTLGGFTLALTLPAAIVITWHSMVASLSLGLTGRRGVITAWSFAGAVLFFGALVGIGWFYYHPTTAPLLLGAFYVCVAALALWKIRSTIRSFVKVRRRGLLDSRAVRFAIGLWLGVAICFLVWVCALWVLTPVPRELLLFVFVWLWPAGEVPGCTLNLASNRHR